MKRIILMLAVLFSIVITGSMAVAVSIQPINIKITAKPGESVPFKVKISSTANRSELINLSITQPLQRLDGGFEFKPADPEKFPEIKWISFDTSQVTIPQGEEKEISGSIKIPLNAKGYHLITIMAEQPPEGKGVLQLSVVYVIKIEIFIEGAVPKLAAEVTDFEMVKGPNGEPSIQFKAENTSWSEYTTYAYVAIRNHTTKKLIEKVELRPGIYWKRSYEPVIIPGATLLYTGSPKEALLPGRYDLQLFFRYGPSGQKILSKTVEVKAGEYVYPAAKLRSLRVDPSEIILNARPGSVCMKGIKLENRSNQPVKVTLKPMDINADYPYAILKDATLELKNGNEFTLGPGRMAVAVLTVKFPKGALAQGYYGLLKIATYDTNGNPNPLEEFDLSIEAIIVGKYTYAVEATDLTYVRDEEKFLLSAVIKNTGNIKFIPQGVISIKNNDGKNVDTVQLTAQEDQGAVLPLKLITLTGVTNGKIAPGNYKAELKITQGNNELGKKVFDFQVK